jgi:hypothetical protein
MNNKWVWGLFASLIVLTVGGSAAQTLNISNRVSVLEAENQHAKDAKREIREDIKEIKRDVQENRRLQEEQIAIMREYLRTTRNR